MLKGDAPTPAVALRRASAGARRRARTFVLSTEGREGLGEVLHVVVEPRGRRHLLPVRSKAAQRRLLLRESEAQGFFDVGAAVGGQRLLVPLVRPVRRLVELALAPGMLKGDAPTPAVALRRASAGARRRARTFVLSTEGREGLGEVLHVVIEPRGRLLLWECGVPHVCPHPVHVRIDAGPRHR